MVVTRLQRHRINCIYVQMFYAAFTSALPSAASTNIRDPNFLSTGVNNARWVTPRWSVCTGSNWNYTARQQEPLYCHPQHPHWISVHEHLGPWWCCCGPVWSAIFGGPNSVNTVSKKLAEGQQMQMQNANTAKSLYLKAATMLPGCNLLKFNLLNRVASLWLLKRG